MQALKNSYFRASLQNEIERDFYNKLQIYLLNISELCELSGCLTVGGFRDIKPDQFMPNGEFFSDT